MTSPPPPPTLHPAADDDDACLCLLGRRLASTWRPPLPTTSSLGASNAHLVASTG